MNKIYKLLLSLLMITSLSACSSKSSKVYKCGHSYDNGSVTIMTYVDENNKITKEEFEYTYNDYTSYGYDNPEELIAAIDETYDQISLNNFNYSASVNDKVLTIKYTLDYENNEDDFAYIAELFYGKTEDEIDGYDYFEFSDDGTCELVK